MFSTNNAGFCVRCRFFESDAILEDEKSARQTVRPVAGHSGVRASQERGPTPGILFGHHHAHGRQVRRHTNVYT